MRSFSDPDTEFYLPHHVTSNMSCGENGHFAGEPTGEVVCVCCWEAALNVDDIPHESTCPQRDVLSRFARERRADGGERVVAADGRGD